MRTPQSRSSRSLARLLMLVLLSLLVVTVNACGSEERSSSSSTAQKAEITPPADIADAGQIVFCSELAFPPVEYIENGETKGSDIDIGDEIAKRMGVKAQYDNTGFDGIIPALLGGKCDAILSGMNVTPERAREVDFVDYFRMGQAIMVPPGNPEGIRTLEDLSGHSVAVSIGSTNKDFLEEASRRLVAAGEDPIDITPFPKDTAGVEALRTGKLDAYFADASIVAFYISQSPGDFEFAGKPIRAVTNGIATNPSNRELHDAIQQAVDAMYADGTIPEVLRRWNLTGSELK